MRCCSSSRILFADDHHSTLPVSVKGYQSTFDGGLLSSPQSLNYMSMKWWTWMLLRLLLAATAAGMAVAVTFFHPVFLSVYFKTSNQHSQDSLASIFFSQISSNTGGLFFGKIKNVGFKHLFVGFFGLVPSERSKFQGQCANAPALRNDAPHRESTSVSDEPVNYHYAMQQFSM